MKIKIPRGKLTREYIDRLALALHSKEQTDKTKGIEEMVGEESDLNLISSEIGADGIKRMYIETPKQNNYYEIKRNASGDWESQPKITSPIL